MSDLHNKDFTLKIKQGLAANINTTATKAQAVAGEPHYTTDGKKLYVFDGTINRRVHGLDMMLTFEGEVLVLDGEVLWLGEY